MTLRPDDVIESARNQRVRDVLRLERPRERASRRLVIVEGVWGIRTVLQADACIEVAFFCPDFFSSDELALLARARATGSRLTQVSVAVLRRLTGRDGPEPILCVVREPVACDVARAGLVCVAQGIEKPGNLGAIVRTACASGADAVLVCDPVTDPFHRASVRASLGTVFLTPIVVLETSAAIRWLRARGLSIVATTPAGDREPWCADLAGPAAILVGNEHHGLSEAWLSAADVCVRIPMPGPTNSLNATTAAGIVLFEAVRQRSVVGG